MRTETQMMDLILSVARQDERIRAVYMNGSRTNADAPEDLFQDYDIVYVVTELGSFLRDESWIDVYGERLIMQEPMKLDQYLGLSSGDTQGVEDYAYLILFSDGNRMDLSLKTAGVMLAEYTGDSLTLPLLDKDGCLPAIPPPDDHSYHIQQPTAGQYFSCCNEFWWCLQNVAKGIWRDELPYVMQMFQSTSHIELDRMVSWWISLRHEDGIATGKMGKYFKRYLPTEYWQQYEQTYSDWQYDHVWDSVFVTCDLFSQLARDVADQLGYPYLDADEANMTRYLDLVRKLPADATEISGLAVDTDA
ncbi:MAG: aminoglycoside 6-adenylyltransferase [Eubacteriales bacterium]|nr:aminoglycoside 6-adenylyltransferase [Eubacteriales bacterium]MDD4461087.1 aminoglycoside 6-adenylyltransferase [Eubacteriales bacterium]